MAKRKRKYSRSAGSDVKSEMHRYKRGTAKSGKGGKGGKVKNRKQAIAIGTLEGAQEGQEGSPEKVASSSAPNLDAVGKSTTVKKMPTASVSSKTDSTRPGARSLPASPANHCACGCHPRNSSSTDLASFISSVSKAFGEPAVDRGEKRTLATSKAKP